MDAVRVITMVPTQVPIISRPAGQCKARATPIAVATPFPPLKSKYTGKRCPKNAQKPHKASTIGGAFSSIAIKIGIIPLATSPRRVATAASFPAARNTLVVPGFCEPVERGSSSPNMRQINIAEEIDPIK